MKNLAFSLTFLCSILLCCITCRATEPGAGDAELEHLWSTLKNPTGNTGPRALMGFALQAASQKWHPERIDQALEMIDTLQNHDATSSSYGNFRWYAWQDKPVDLNAVEFTMQQGILLWNLYRDNLNPAGRGQLEKIINLGEEGIRRHPVKIEYTNIFLMKTWNSIAIGEAFHRDDLTRDGYSMLQQWMDYISINGISEYLSPIYTGVDINSLALISRFAAQEQGRETSRRALQFIYWQSRATWFAPDLRLGGTHSRDYDYLTGHGEDLERHLADWGWIPGYNPGPGASSAFDSLTDWRPTDITTFAGDMTVPRFVWVKWGKNPGQNASLYLGQTICMGTAGAGNGPEDKFFVINYDGGPKMVMGNFFMDGRGDPYGHKPVKGPDGHVKAHHLSPFVVSVQQGADALIFCSYGGPTEVKHFKDPPAVCLYSHLDLPEEVSIWQNNREVTVPGNEGVPLATDQPTFLRYGNTVVALTFIQSTDDKGNPVPPVYYRDGGKYHACRISWIHATGVPAGEAHVLLWAHAAVNIDDASFPRFRDEFRRTKPELHSSDGKIEAAVETTDGKLTLATDLKTGSKTTSGAPHDGIFEVNGKEIGKSILGSPASP